jgi:DNA-binding LytR/AlgR family response regulator
LYTLEKRLEAEPFFRCHNAFLVNLDEVRTVSSSEVTVQGMRIPVSKYRKKEFMQALAAFRGRQL